MVDPGTFCPLHTIFDPDSEESGSTGVVDGLARISGKWCVLIGFNNKWIAGAWIAGQAENNLRVTDLAKRMNLPLVWLVNCSGVKLPEQEKVYANRLGPGDLLFPPRGARTDGDSRIGGDLRDQPRRRRLPGDQPDDPFGPQEGPTSPWGAAASSAA